VKGEITPAYAILPKDRVRLVHRVMPDVRLVFLMRNPIDRAWSQATMDLLYNTDRSVGDVSESEFLAHLESAGNLERGDYARTIDTWLSEFRADQLFLGFFDDIRASPMELLRSVFEFLGVTTTVEWSEFPLTRVVRPGARGRTPPPIPDFCEEFLRERYAAQLAELRDRFGVRVANWR
jgi:hypothetical protein